jgi:hypoxanthine phosphoribosyltransferase
VPIAVWLEKALHLLGVEVKQVISVRTIGYNGFKIKDKIEICDDCHLKSFNFEKNDKILIVDDLIDTGKTIKTIVDWLTRGSFNLVRENVRTAVLFYKKNEHFVPDYYELLFDRWLVFPHELEGLEKNEICDIHGQSVATMLETLLPTIG